MKVFRMKVIVLGSGVVGLTSAWYLAQAGHQVTVVDRQAQSAEETSFANAGQISYGYSSPWAAPGVPLKAMKWLTQKHSPLIIKPGTSPELYLWTMALLKNCSEKNYQVNKSRMLRVSNYSRQCLLDLRKNHDIIYEGRQQGTLQVFRKQSQVEAVEKDMQLLSASDTRFKLLNVEECVEKEPGLALVKKKIVAGLHLPDDETGDCYQFCQQLTDLAKKAGVEFKFNVQVNALLTEHEKITAVDSSIGTLTADAYVVALGCYSAQLLKTVGVSLPVYPVKGYSLTLPMENAQYSPVSTVMDETYKVALTRFDDRIRVAGTAELAGFNLDLSEKRKATIAMVVQDLFPQAGDISKAEFWTGLRPMTPDGTPIIGKTNITNLYTNTGHGTLGWTMACGSGKLLADVVSGRETDIDASGLDSFRYLYQI
ncbi:D-amino acid dehydrogenase [Colwellia sp. Arc7-635]|uniref:D-amino acid dehydrogenase n=1 Tax=Colwellia sp. Arc7-635 TaxID=2497879 RepID=UPI002407C9A7|nr:D-amino acid dehydrogenase [Colwellia sp. Arc7-635]